MENGNNRPENTTRLQKNRHRHHTRRLGREDVGEVCRYQNGATLEKYINDKMNMNKGLKSI